MENGLILSNEILYQEYLDELEIYNQQNLINELKYISNSVNVYRNGVKSIFTTINFNVIKEITPANILEKMSLTSLEGLTNVGYFSRMSCAHEKIDKILYQNFNPITLHKKQHFIKLPGQLRRVLQEGYFAFFMGLGQVGLKKIKTFEEQMLNFKEEKFMILEIYLPKTKKNIYYACY